MEELTVSTNATTQVPSPRKGKRDLGVTELTVICKVRPGHEKAIREVLDGAITGDAQREAVRRELQHIGTLHEARNLLFDDDTRLLIATSFDGDWDTYIDDFTPFVLPMWDKFLIHCEGYPEGGASTVSIYEVKEYLNGHQHTASSFLRTNPGSFKQISKALAVQQAFQQVLDDPAAAEALQHPALKPLLEQAAD
jgi:hypothetical protein